MIDQFVPPTPHKARFFMSFKAKSKRKQSNAGSELPYASEKVAKQAKQQKQKPKEQQLEKDSIILDEKKKSLLKKNYSLQENLKNSKSFIRSDGESVEEETTEDILEEEEEGEESDRERESDLVLSSDMNSNSRTSNDVVLSESELNVINELNLACECPSHAGKECLDKVYNINADYVYNCLFGFNEFHVAFNQMRKVTNPKISDWYIENGVKTRRLEYSVASVGILSGKGCRNLEIMRLRKYEKNQVYVADSESFIFNVPYADHFKVDTRYCITRVNQNQSRLRIHGEITFLQKTNFIIKSLIERNIHSGLHEHYHEFDKQFSAEINRLKNLPTNMQNEISLSNRSTTTNESISGDESTSSRSNIALNNEEQNSTNNNTNSTNNNNNTGETYIEEEPVSLIESSPLNAQQLPAQTLKQRKISQTTTTSSADLLAKMSKNRTSESQSSSKNSAFVISSPKQIASSANKKQSMTNCNNIKTNLSSTPVFEQPSHHHHPHYQTFNSTHPSSSDNSSCSPIIECSNCKLTCHFKNNQETSTSEKVFLKIFFLIMIALLVFNFVLYSKLRDIEQIANNLKESQKFMSRFDSKQL